MYASFGSLRTCNSTESERMAVLSVAFYTSQAITYSMHWHLSLFILPHSHTQTHKIVCNRTVPTSCKWIWHSNTNTWFSLKPCKCYKFFSLRWEFLERRKKRTEKRINHTFQIGFVVSVSHFHALSFISNEQQCIYFQQQ